MQKSPLTTMQDTKKKKNILRFFVCPKGKRFFDVRRLPKCFHFVSKMEILSTKIIHVSFFHFETFQMSGRLFFAIVQSFETPRLGEKIHERNIRNAFRTGFAQ